MRPRPFAQVDVFTATPYRGNPLAVVLDGADLSDAEMAHFATWTNLSETTFVLPPTPEGAAAGADYRVRIFTPGGELPFAGHPTLGTCHAWLKHGGRPRQPGTAVQECGVGLVNIRLDGGRPAFAAPPLRRTDVADATLHAALPALGLQPEQVLAAQHLDNGPHWMGLLLDHPDTVAALQPDHATLARLGLNVGVAALTHPKAHDADAPGVGLIRRASREARAFATGLRPASDEPATAPDHQLLVRGFVDVVGVPEDPVTGSLNASLAQWLMADGWLPDTYVAAQGQALGRDGRVYLTRDASGQVWVGGDVADCILGSVTC
jgi:PhzF family phenazine biosynthesis protein